MAAVGQLSSLDVQSAIDLFCQGSYSDDKKVDIIQELAERNLFEVVGRFKEFEVESEKYRYKVAICLAAKSGRLVSSRIKNFELSGNRLVKIATRAIENDLSGTLEHFQNYALDENDAHRLVLAAASLDGVQVAKYFRKLGIATPDKVYSIAEAAFSNSARGCSKYIKNFNLEDESKRFELLRVRLQEDADKALQLLASFQIHRREYRVEAAILAANYDGWNFSARVEEWQIPDEEDRFKIFQSAFSNHPAGALRYIKNYKLSIPKVVAVFDMAIRDKVSSIQDYLPSSGLDEKSCFDLRVRCADENPERMPVEMNGIVA